jgi:hypothetical protein
MILNSLGTDWLEGFPSSGMLGCSRGAPDAPGMQLGLGGDESTVARVCVRT